MGEWSHSCCDVGNCQYLFFLSAGVLIISFGYCKRESSSLFSVVFMVVAEEIYTYVACDSGNMWAYMFVVCCFSCTMIRKLFSHFKLQGRFFSSSVTYLVKFEPDVCHLVFGFVWCWSGWKNHTHLMFNKTEVFAWQKNLKRATRHFSPTDNIHSLKSLLLYDGNIVSLFI